MTTAAIFLMVALATAPSPQRVSAEQCAYDLASKLLPIAERTVGIDDASQLQALLDISNTICKSDDVNSMANGIARAFNELRLKKEGF